MPSEPTTEAGKRLFARLWAVNDYAGASRIIAGVQGDIAAIEAEARAALLDELRGERDALRKVAEVARGLLKGSDPDEVLPDDEWDPIYLDLRDALALLDDHKKGAGK